MHPTLGVPERAGGVTVTLFHAYRPRVVVPGVPTAPTVLTDHPDHHTTEGIMRTRMRGRDLGYIYIDVTLFPARL